jgi:hypothetical protein
MTDSSPDPAPRPFGLHFLEIPPEQLEEVDGGAGDGAPEGPSDCRPPPLNTHAVSSPMATLRCPDYT